MNVVGLLSGAHYRHMDTPYRQVQRDHVPFSTLLGSIIVPASFTSFLTAVAPASMVPLSLVSIVVVASLTRSLRVGRNTNIAYLRWPIASAAFSYARSALRTHMSCVLHIQR